MAIKHFLFAIYQLSIIVICFSQRFPGDRCRDASGRDGTCTLLDECPDAQEDLKKGIRPVNCGFQNRNPIVCCSQRFAELTAVTTPIPVGMSKSEYWCNEYMKNCPVYILVVGGEKALPGEFPHMAAIGYGDQNRIVWNCGGTLISDKFILTAAHCMNSREDGPARWVLLAAELLINMTSPDGRKGQIHPVVRRIRHPGYEPPSKYNDIALLEISSAVTPNALSTNSYYLHPACLPTTDVDYNYDVIIATGWGRVGYGEDGSPELLKVQLNLFESDTCNKAFEVEIKTTSALRNGIDSTMMCAGVPEGGKDTCQGDSGGPLQIPVRYNCMYKILGITSFGKICGFANSPSVYTRVSAYIPWIEDIVWPN